MEDDFSPRPPIFPSEWIEEEITSAPLTKQTFEYALLSAEYGSAIAYERWIELLSMSLGDAVGGGDDEF